MREAMLILPQHDNQGASLQHVRHYVEKALAASFGGFTVANAKGGWINRHGELMGEHVWTFTVAAEVSPASDAKLASIARYMLTEGKQQAIYVRYPSGDVELIEAKPLAALAA